MLYTVPRDAVWRDCAATLRSLENLFPRPYFQTLPTSGNSCGLVAWVYPRRFPWLACTLSSAASGRQRCGVVLLPSACPGSEAVSAQQHPWVGKMHDPFRWQVLGSQAAMHLTLSGSARENPFRSRYFPVRTNVASTSIRLRSQCLQWFHERSQFKPGRRLASSQTSSLRRVSRHTMRSAKNTHRRRRRDTRCEVIAALYAKILWAKNAPPSPDSLPSTRIEPKPPYGNNGGASSSRRSES